MLESIAQVQKSNMRRPAEMQKTLWNRQIDSFKSLTHCHDIDGDTVRIDVHLYTENSHTRNPADDDREPKERRLEKIMH